MRCNNKKERRAAPFFIGKTVYDKMRFFARRSDDPVRRVNVRFAENSAAIRLDAGINDGAAAHNKRKEYRFGGRL